MCGQREDKFIMKSSFYHLLRFFQEIELKMLLTHIAKYLESSILSFGWKAGVRCIKHTLDYISAVGGKLDCVMLP